MQKELTLDDVLNEQIDPTAFEKRPEEKPKSFRRIRSGIYAAQVTHGWIRQIEQGPQTGRKYMSLKLSLFDLADHDEYEGSCFTKISWVRVTKENGKPDLPFKLFQDMIQVIQAPPDAALNDVIPAIVGEYATVTGSEYLYVAPEDLLPGDRRKLLGPPRTKNIVFAENDEQVNHYLDLGYKSEFMPTRFAEIAS